MDIKFSSNINIGSTVDVIGTDITARVTAIILEESSIQYRITYWLDNQRRNDWVAFEEITIS